MEKNRYLNECKQFFPFITKKEKNFLNRLDASLNEFIEINKSYNYEDLLHFFGTPKEVVISYFKNCDEDYLIRKIKISCLSKNFLFFNLILSIVGISIVIFSTSKMSKKQL